jgi:drug/metabolite transporter (DMT)-like permease
MDGSNQRLHGVAFAIASGFAFSLVGPLVKPLMGAGWSPAAAATGRLACGAIAMGMVATMVNPGWVREAVTRARTVTVYGLVPIAGVQLCYIHAVAHLQVRNALLLVYLAPILVTGWVWATTRRPPSALTLIGTALAFAGLVVALNVSCGGNRDVVGVAWALGATMCMGCYYLLSDRYGAGGTGIHSITLAAAGLAVAAVAVPLLGLTGAMPLTFTVHDTIVAGHSTSFVVPIVICGVICTAGAYLLGIWGVARLRASYASLLGLSEVLFAVPSAWVLLGEAVTVREALGAAVVLAGLALASRPCRTFHDVPPIDSPWCHIEEDKKVNRWKRAIRC